MKREWLAVMRDACVPRTVGAAARARVCERERGAAGELALRLHVVDWIQGVRAIAAPTFSNGSQRTARSTRQRANAGRTDIAKNSAPIQREYQRRRRARLRAQKRYAFGGQFSLCEARRSGSYLLRPWGPAA